MNKGLRVAGWVAAGVLASAGGVIAQQHAAAVGIFRGSSDIGTAQAGATTFDPATQSYRMSGGGSDIWGTADEFSFTWVKFSGDGSLSADVSLERPLTYPISKAVLMFRQSLAPGAAYADVAIHGDGHATLQWRATEGGETKDTTLPEHAPVRIRIERKGDRFTAYAVFADGHLGAPASVTVPLRDPVYVGLGVGSHNVNALQTAVFSKVKLEGK